MGHHSQCNLFRIMCGKLSAQKAVILSTFRLPEPRLSPYLRGDIYVGSSVFRLEYIWILCFGADLQASDVMCCARLAGESSDAAEVHWVSRCGHTATGKIFSLFLSPLSFFQLLIHPLWVQRSQVIIVQRPERKMRLGGGGERGRQEVGGGGLECLCDTEREKQTEKEEERRLCVCFTS